MIEMLGSIGQSNKLMSSSQQANTDEFNRAHEYEELEKALDEAL